MSKNINVFGNIKLLHLKSLNEFYFGTVDIFRVDECLPMKEFKNRSVNYYVRGHWTWAHGYKYYPHFTT